MGAGRKESLFDLTEAWGFGYLSVTGGCTVLLGQSASKWLRDVGLGSYREPSSGLAPIQEGFPCQVKSTQRHTHATTTPNV